LANKRRGIGGGQGGYQFKKKTLKCFIIIIHHYLYHPTIFLLHRRWL